MRDVLDYLFQSTLPARGATARGRRKPAGSRISIHAPRTGSDNSRLICVTSSVRFQSTLPARGATSQMTENASGMELFQSTLPARGATAYNADIPRIAVISIHAPRTGSDNVPRTQIGLRQHFNPRSPHGERRGRTARGSPPSKFQSTLPARGATKQFQHIGKHDGISIHAPRTGSDL